MKAAVCRAFGSDLTIEEVTLDPPGQYEVQVELKACGICHSDVSYIDGAWGGPLPAVFGHEAAGIVAAVGPDVTAVKPGDHVVVTLIRRCGACYFCTRDHTELCEATFPLDGARRLHDARGTDLIQGLRTGAFAEAVVVEQSQLAPIPHDLPFAEASLLACGVLTGWGAVVNTAGVTPGSNVAVIGLGGVGVNSLQAAAFLGADPILAVDLRCDKLEVAAAFGATDTINPVREDLGARVRALSDGRGFDHVFVTVGKAAAIQAGLGMLRPGGTLVLVGMPADGDLVQLDAGEIAGKGQRILGSKMGQGRIDRDIPALIDHYRQGRLKLDALISGRYALDEINEAIASTRRGEALRNVIIF